MKKTDYTPIAPNYDDNEIRLRIPVDAHLSAHLQRRSGHPRAVLDLACGTGNFLRVHTEALAEQDITWHGLDASEAMLSVAAAKVPSAVLRHGYAEALPYEDASFDYAVVNFAFHHFADKPRVLDELRRVLRPDGALRIANIAPERMPGWWLYHFFPEGRLEDEKRFWSVSLLLHELEQRGFDVRARIELELGPLALATIHQDALRRDISELQIIGDDAWRRGIARIEAALAAGATSVRDELALLCCRASRREG